MARRLEKYQRINGENGAGGVANAAAA